MQEAEPGADYVITHTRNWVEKVVIGLNLCPFARRPFQGGMLRFVASEAQDEEALLGDLVKELQHLVDTPGYLTETTLLIHPFALRDFDDFLDFWGMTEDLLAEAGLEGEIQIAGFHPDFEFDGEDAAAVSVYTNRSPYPMLHLLREQSVGLAADTHPDTSEIPKANIRLLEEMGIEKLKTLLEACRP